MGNHAVRRSRLRQALGLALVIGAVAMIGATTAGAVIHFGADQDPDPGVQAIVDGEFDGSCVTSSDAVRDLNGSLASAGFDEWQVRSRADDVDCVAGGLDGSTSTIFLFPVQRPDVTDAVHGAQADLMSNCLGKNEAIAFVSSVLEAAGVEDFRVETDGPFAYPLDQEEQVKQHVAEGCWVYSASGHADDGTPTYYLSGRD